MYKNVGLNTSRIILRFFLFIIVTLLTFSTGCSKIPPDAFIIGSIGDAINLNPILNSDSASSTICSLVFNGLVKINDKLEYIPDLAAKWEVTPDGMVWTFYLKRNVKWQDGAPLTAYDVKFTINSIMNPNVQSPRKSSYELIKKIVVVDKYTIKFILKKPYAPFLDEMGMQIIPEHILKNEDINNSSFNRHPVGTGMFRFIKWKTGEWIYLKRNPEYFDRIPKIPSIYYKVVPDQNVLRLQLRTGEVDMSGLQPKDYLPMKTTPEVNVYDYETSGYTYIGFNLNNPLFKDKKIRQAIAMAIDREAIVEKVVLGMGKIAHSTIPPISWAYNPDVKKYPYNPQKAIKLLKECGWIDTDRDGIIDKNGKPFKFILMTNQGNKVREDITVIVQQQLHQIGITCQPKIIEWATFIDRYVDAKKFDAVVLGWALGIDPDQYSIWHSSQINGGLNFISYKNQEVDKLLELGRTTIDREKRKKYYNRFQEIISEEQPYVFLFYPKAIEGIRKRIGGVKNPTPAGLLLHIDEWYIKK